MLITNTTISNFE